jgi:membrane protease YdiL (CAAX protease family)/NAD-dependent dihydropyrimidine dehydrogenase PreA subunit
VSGTGVHLALHPDRCDRCGRCVPACPVDAVRIGPSYISVDWSRCTQCFACADTCKRQAIQRAVVPARGEAVGAPLGDTSKVVVGSRAEAKAVRKAAKKASKARGKSVAYGGKPAAVTAASTEGGTVGNAARGVLAPTVADAVAESGAGAAPGIGGRSQAAGAPPRASASRAEDDGTPYMPGSVVWSGADLVLVLAMLLVTVLAKDAALGLHAVGLMPAAGRTVVRAVVLGVYYSVQLAVFAWLAARHRATLSGAFGLLGNAKPKGPIGVEEVASPSAVGSLGLVVALFAGTEAFAIAYGLAMQAAGLSQPARLSSDLSEVFGSGGAGLALAILLVALVAPFVEELAFRGVVMPVLGARWGMWPAVIGSSLIYAAYHFSLWLFAPTLVLGIALGWLAWTRRSLWPAVLLHVLYNAAAVGAGFFVAR